MLGGVGQRLRGDVIGAPAPGLSPPHPSPRQHKPRPARGTGVHPSTSGITPCPPTTESATGASTTDDHDPRHRRESSRGNGGDP
jgi:hypothetical protein